MNNNTLSSKKNAILFFFALMLSVSATAQIYQHNFGTTPITANPYNGTPSTLHPDLSGSSWTNNTGAWLNVSGSSGTALGATSPTATVTTYTDVTLTFNVASGKELQITSFNFWRQRSPSAAQTWSLLINGITVGTGTVPTTGAAIGNTAVSTPVTGLTGTITVVVRFNNSPSGSGSLRLDDFTLNGTITTSSSPPPCPIDVTSFFPATGPENTLVTLTGSGFNSATGVTFDGVSATFAPLSDTEMVVLVPAGVTTGNIVVIGPGCSENVTGNFDIINSECQGEIYISELYDNNGGSYGVIELYNPTSNTVTFGGQYVLERYGTIGDLNPSGGYILTLPGSIPPYSTYLVSSSSSGPSGCPSSFESNIGNGINASDEFKLKKNGVVIDRAYAPGNIGYTVKRKPDAIAPAPIQNWSDWTTTSNTCADLGSHTTTVGGGGTVPEITHPVTQYVCENASATFSVSLSGTGYTYQWKVLNESGVWVNVTNDANYSGATTNTLDIQDIPFSFNGNQYYCEITSSNCDLVSNAAQLNITEAPVIDTAIATATDCTSDTGTITITATTAEFGLQYSIDGVNYPFTNVFTDLPAGDYTVTIRNLSGCVSEQVIVTVGGSTDPDVATTTIIQPTCEEPMGTILIDAPIGVDYTYSIGGAFQTSTTFSVTPGIYTVTVINALGCTSETEEIVINELTTLPDPTTTVTQPTCDEPTGTIVVTGPTGTGYTYSIGGAYQASNIFEDLPPDSYTITVQDTGGCTSNSVTVIINPASNAPADATVTYIQPTCTVATGTITVTAQTGNGIEYSIDNGATYQASNVFAGYDPGDYTVVVRNGDGCVSTPVTATIDPAPSTPADATVAYIQPTCTVATGTITVTTQTGNGIEYSIDNGVTYQASNVFAGYDPGDYTVVVRNGDGCVSSPVTATIDPAPNTPADATVTYIQPTCTVATGTITVTAQTGNGIEYSIDNGVTYQASNVFAGYDPGDYTVVVRNGDGCVSSPVTATIDPAPNTPADATVTYIQPTCTVATGTITVQR
ncbi:hypothetical protein IDF54_01390 [Flavobacterium sp. SaA2.13]|nr:hypothetical protein [Flavobacterium sp. SaA2.13]